MEGNNQGQKAVVATLTGCIKNLLNQTNITILKIFTESLIVSNLLAFQGI